MIFGYAGVSTDAQSIDAQVKALCAARAKKSCRNTASGAKTDRAQRAAIDGLGEGDACLSRASNVSRESHV